MLLVLVLKKTNVVTFSDYRPLSMCNILNKIFSKVIANRMACLLPNMIFLEQSAFVKGREIVDNIILALELVTYMGCNNRGRNVAIKLNMEKAYDWVDWRYMIWVLRAFGFGEEWISIV